MGALGFEGGAVGGGSGEEGVEGGGISQGGKGLLDGVEEDIGADGVGVAGAAEGAPVGVGVAAVVVDGVGAVELEGVATTSTEDEAGDGGDARVATSATAGAFLEDGAMGGGVPGGGVGGRGVGGDQVGTVGDEAGVAVVVEDVADRCHGPAGGAAGVVGGGVEAPGDGVDAEAGEEEVGGQADGFDFAGDEFASDGVAVFIFDGAVAVGPAAMREAAADAGANADVTAAGALDVFDLGLGALDGGEVEAGGFGGVGQVVGHEGGVGLGAGGGDEGFDLGDEGVGAPEAIASTAPEDVEDVGVAIGAELVVGGDVGLGVGVEDVFSAMAGDLIGGDDGGADGGGEGLAVAELGGEGVFFDGSLGGGGDGGEDGEAGHDA